MRDVNLSGTATGDGAIRALAAKRELCDFRTGNAVTDAGLALLRDIGEFRDRFARFCPDALLRSRLAGPR